MRYGLRDAKVVKDLAIYLLSNAGKEFSFNKLKKLFNFGSTNTVISYVSFYEESYLLFTVSKFDFSFKKQLVNPKKVYSIDIGLSRANSVSFSKDSGRVLENLVFLYLRRMYKDIFFFKGDNECDFLIREKGKVSQAIQVCYKLSEDNKEREINGLKEAMSKFGLVKGIIITFNQKDKLGNIIVKPVWELLT